MEADGQDPSRPASEEAAKTNTDCVYFLASPLTCKKGNECEYRHSEGARVNPRDCWFWMNGSCLNPKCSFRHPPLDGFLGDPTTTHPGFTLPSTQTAMLTPVAAAPTHTSNKQGIPCYYFQKGGCLKGDRCPFMHDVQPSNNPVAQQTAKVNTLVTEPSSGLKSTSWVLENCGQHNAPTINAHKPVEVSQASSKADVKAERMLTSGLSVASGIAPSPLSNVTSHTFSPANAARAVSDLSIRPEGHHLEPLNRHVHNGRDVDESLRESSPGFDVLVDDECEDTDYFHVDGRDNSNQEVKNLDVVNDFDYHHSSVYNSMDQFERETHKIHNEVREYDQHGRHEKYGQDNCRYSVRIVDTIREKRSSHREDCPNEIDGSDLRRRLLKKRKVNGLRSAINADHHGEPSQKDDRFAEKQRCRSHSSDREQHHLAHESSISKRLQGRITLPERPPSDNPSNMRSEKERDKGKDWDKSSSPGHPLNYQGRLHDRITWSTHEAKKLEGQPRRDEADPLHFAGPKRLAELKGAKFSNDTKDRLSKINNTTITQEQKNLRLNKALGLHEPEGSSSFEGPKSLSEILKRKREAALGNDDTSSNGHENNQKVIEDHVVGPMITASADNQDICLLESKNRECLSTSKTEVQRSTTAEEEDPSMAGGEELSHTDQSSAMNEPLAGEDDRPAENIEDPESGAYEQEEGEFEYEIAEGTDFKTEDSEELLHPEQSSHKEEMLESEDGMPAENMENSEDNYDQRDGELECDVVESTDFRTYDENDQKDEDNEDDEDDDDDFARKIGVMFS